MTNRTRNYLLSLMGFASAPLLTAIVLAAVDAARFHPGGEFATALQAAEFDFFVWGLLLLASGIGYAAVSALLLPFGRTIPWPKVIGFMAGAACVIAADLGLIKWLHGLVHLPWPVVTGIPGIAAGICVVAIIGVAAAFRRAAPVDR